MRQKKKFVSLLASGLIWAFLIGPKSLAQQAPATPTCAGCHAKEAASYQATGMGRSFSLARAESVPKQAAPFFHQASGTYFLLVQRGARLYHRRWQQGPQGKEVNVEELEIHNVMGSGKHALTFLHRNARGALIELPLGWYAEKGGYFAMNPGFDNPQPATRRKIDYDCMGCHNAVPRIPAGHKTSGAEPVYEGALPEGIDCQRCHGPGERHVAAVNTTGSSVEKIRKSIVNPARLPVERQREVCMQCHLETTSGQLPSMIRRFEREPFSYQAGEPLGEYSLSFDHAPASGLGEKFEIVSAAYRLRKSACYLKSAAMTCTTCHNPHARDGVREAGACRSCHSSKSLETTGKHPAGEDCAGCHMPKRRAEDAVHVVMTDHFIQRRPPVGAMLAEISERKREYRGEVVPYYPAAGLDALSVAVAQVLHGSNLTAGIPQLEEALRRRPKEPEYYVTLGNAWQQMRRPDKAVEAFQWAVQLQPKSARLHRFLGIALQDSGNASKAAESLQRSVALDPSDAVAWHQLGLLDSAAGRFKEAAAKASKAIALDPDLLEARNSLGASLAALGDMAASEKAFRDALRVDPYFATAHGNLARLLVRKGEGAEVLLHFERAVRLRPDFAPDRHEYALALVRANRFAEAREEVDAALRLSPEFVDGLILSGGLWAREGKLEEARRNYESALGFKPESGRAHLDLARVLAPLGDRNGTITHLRLAAKSGDVAAAALARQALRNIGIPIE